MAEENQNQAPEGAQIGYGQEGAASGEREAAAEGSAPLDAQASDEPESAVYISARPKRELRMELIAIRDRAKEPELIGAEENEDFIPYSDCDALLAKGTIVDLGGVPCRLLVDAPVMSASLRDEQAFAEVLSRTPGNLSANAKGLRQRYNSNGRAVGLNEDHGYNRLCAEIARLDEEIAAEVAAEEAAAAQAEPQSEE